MHIGLHGYFRPSVDIITASPEQLKQWEQESKPKAIVCSKCAYPHLEGQPCLCDLS